jgi:hypothetical protein
MIACRQSSTLTYAQKTIVDETKRQGNLLSDLTEHFLPDQNPGFFLFYSPGCKCPLRTLLEARVPHGAFARRPTEATPWLSKLLRSSLVSRHTRTKERVVESAGIRSYRKRSGPDRWHNRPWSGSGGGRQGTEPLPALGTARPLGFEERELSRYL